MDSDMGQHQTSCQGAESGGCPTSACLVCHEIIKTRPLTAQKGRLRPREVGGSQGESLSKLAPGLLVLLQSRALSAVTFLFSWAADGRGRGPAPEALSSPSL